METNEIETRKTIEKISETKSCFSEKVNKIYKYLARLNKKKQRKAQINKIVNDRGDITTENINTKDRKKLL